MSKEIRQSVLKWPHREGGNRFLNFHFLLQLLRPIWYYLQIENMNTIFGPLPEGLETKLDEGYLVNKAGI